MKKQFLTVAFAAMFIIGGAAVTSCGNSEDHDHDGDHHEHMDGEHMEGEHMDGEHAHVYQCPMKCEGDKTYDKAGKCPACGMDLEEVEE